MKILKHERNMKQVCLLWNTRAYIASVFHSRQWSNSAWTVVDGCSCTLFTFSSMDCSHSRLWAPVRVYFNISRLESLQSRRILLLLGLLCVYRCQ